MDENWYFHKTTIQRFIIIISNVDKILKVGKGQVLEQVEQASKCRISHAAFKSGKRQHFATSWAYITKIEHNEG